MSLAASPSDLTVTSPAAVAPPRRRLRMPGRIFWGGAIVGLIFLLCFVTLPWTLAEAKDITVPDLAYNHQVGAMVRTEPSPVTKLRPLWAADDQKEAARVIADEIDLSNPAGWFGYDALGRSILGRCLLGGTLSLLIGFVAAAIAVVLGTTVGLIAGYKGGWVDSILMRSVDTLYGLPYILLVVLFKVGLEPTFMSGAWFPIGVILVIVASLVVTTLILDARRPTRVDRNIAYVRTAVLTLGGLLLAWPLLTQFVEAQKQHHKFQANEASVVILFLAIGLVSWLTMARVVRGQVLTLREMPFIEACRAMGIPETRIFLRHVLPNLIGPITVYATLTVPSAILQESFLSFLGVGVRLPLPTWGNLASEGVAALSPIQFYWWMLLFPCLLLMVTLLSLNFLGDGLRDWLDPKKDGAKL